MVVHFSILAWRIPLAGDTFYSPWGCKELNTAQWLSTDISHSYIFLEKCLFESFAHFWIGLLFLLLLRFWSSLYILDIIFYQVFSCQILSPILWVALLLCWQCLLMQKIKNFSWSPLSVFLHCLWLWCRIQEIIAKSNVVKLLSFVFF